MLKEPWSEFILEQQARFEANFAKIESELAQTQRVLRQTNRVVSGMVRVGVSLRSDVRRHERAIARLGEVHAETDDKLNALIDIVDKAIRRNGRK
ncbi:MAG TPA: hypothetical protein VI455_08045 [Terriglobia bacterium]